MNAIDPRFRAPIPTTAETPARFIPLCLDPVRAFERDLPLLEHNAASLRDGGDEIAADEVLAEIQSRRTKALADADRLPAPPEFLIRVPTAQERDSLNARLLEMGLTQVSNEQIRASMIEAIYEIDWAAETGEPVDEDGRASFNEERADEHASFLDGIWQRESIQVEAFQKWRDQESERVLDAIAGAPLRAETPMPVRIISVRDEARARLLADRLTETPRMRKLVAKKLDFGRRNAMIIARLNLLGVESSVLTPVAPSETTGTVSEEAIEQMRRELEREFGTALGDQAYAQLIDHIDSLYTLDGFEAGNFDSPPGKLSDQTGSIAPSGDIEISGGLSTTSSTEAPPAAESAKTTGKSSGTSSDSAAPKRKPSPTAEA